TSSLTSPTPSLTHESARGEAMTTQTQVPLSPKAKKARIDALATRAGTEPGGAIRSGKGVSLWQSAWRRLRRNYVFLTGLVIVVLFILLALTAGWIAPHDPAERLLIEQVNRQSNPVPGPQPGFPLGADDRGRDLLSRLIVGSRQTLIIGVFATLGGLLGGSILGTLAGAFGGWVDAVVMRIVDVLLSIPSLPMAFPLAALSARPRPCAPARASGPSSWPSRSCRSRSSPGCSGARCSPSGTPTTCSPPARSGCVTHRSCCGTCCPTPSAR